jgi:cyclophilin family peptidyl-prolyl cis-trans isomerase
VDTVQLALQYAETVGLDYTPFIVINGRVFGGDPTFEVLSEVTNIFLTISKTIEPIASKTCPPMTIDKNKKYTATVTTSKGDFAIELYASKAPLAVNSFVFLAKRGWFDGIPFHRVIPDFVAQTGDPSGTGMGNPGYAFNNEIDASLKFDKAGVVGMANAGPNTNGSQIFITYAAQPHLDGFYTIFGQVTTGMDVVTQLTERDVEIGAPSDVAPDKILKVVIKEE